MSEGKYVHGIVSGFMAVQRNVAGIAERDDEFTQFRHLRKRSTHVGARFQKREYSFNGLTGALRRLRIFGHQELAATFQALPCPRGDDYS